MTYEEWKGVRNNSAKKNILVVNKRLFAGIVELLSDCDDIAYISIEGTEDCAIANRYMDNEHLLIDSDNVLNLNFDDVDEDITDSMGYTYKAIDSKQAMQIVDFVESNAGKHFVVHCRAGRSRSQAVRRAMLDLYEDDFEESPVNRLNPCSTPNMAVVAAIKRAFYEKHDVFGAV